MSLVARGAERRTAGDRRKTTRPPEHRWPRLVWGTGRMACYAGRRAATTKAGPSVGQRFAAVVNERLAKQCGQRPITVSDVKMASVNGDHLKARMAKN